MEIKGNGNLRMLHGQWYGYCRVVANGKTCQKTHKLGVTAPGGGIGRKKATDALDLWVDMLRNYSPAATTPIPKYIRKMVEELEKSKAIESSSASKYETSIKYIEDYFGTRSIGSITEDDVSKFENGLLRKGLATSTVRKTHFLLRQTMNYAIARHELNENVVSKVKPPKMTKSGPNSLDTKERVRLLADLEASLEVPETLGAYIAIKTGMRRGEIAGLRWRDVDFNRGRICVRSAVGIKKGGTYLKPTKTRQFRQVPMTNALNIALKKRQANMQDECQEEGVPFSEDLFVLGHTDGTPMQPYVLSRYWELTAKRLNLIGSQGRRAVFHDLRHTYATAAIQSHEVDIETLAAILGHASTQMTLDTYGLATESGLERAGNIMDDALER